jgi:hypothetical protein
MVPLLLLLPAAGAQSWLTRAERADASNIQMAFRRPQGEQPTCGTSDPGVVQMMMLPAMALGDIMMSHVMHPLMSMLTGRDEAEVAARRDTAEETPGREAPPWRGAPPGRGGRRPAGQVGAGRVPILCLLHPSGMKEVSRPRAGSGRPPRRAGAGAASASTATRPG